LRRGMLGTIVAPLRFSTRVTLAQVAESNQ